MRNDFFSYLVIPVFYALVIGIFFFFIFGFIYLLIDTKYSDSELNKKRIWIIAQILGHLLNLYLCIFRTNFNNYWFLIGYLISVYLVYIVYQKQIGRTTWYIPDISWFLFFRDKYLRKSNNINLTIMNDEINLSGLSFENYWEKVQKAINRRKPIFIKWRNKRELLTTENIKIMAEQMEQYLDYFNKFSKLEVEKIFHPNTLNNLIEKKFADFKMDMEKQFAEHKTFLAEQDSKAKTSYWQAERINIENNILQLKGFAEARMINVRAETLNRLFDLLSKDALTFEFVLALTKLIDPRANLGVGQQIPDDFVNLAIGKGLAEIDLLSSQSRKIEMDSQYRNEETVRERLENQYNDWKIEQNKKNV